MSIRKIYLSAFIKQCPYCENIINTRTLRKVLRETAPRWHHISHAPHTARPECGGFVTSTVGNSPWLVGFMLLLAGGVMSQFYWPGIRLLVHSSYFLIVGLAVACGVAWLATWHSELVREPLQR